MCIAYSDGLAESRAYKNDLSLVSFYLFLRLFETRIAFPFDSNWRCLRFAAFFFFLHFNCNIFFGWMISIKKKAYSLHWHINYFNEDSTVFYWCDSKRFNYRNVILTKIWMTVFVEIRRNFELFVSQIKILIMK